MKPGRLAFYVSLVVVVVAMSWLTLTNYSQVVELRDEGYDPITVATPGVSGKDGLPGPKGDKGDQGVPGYPGADGRDGTDGVNGKDGSQGPLGPVGPTGATGATGSKGDKGDKGDAGSSAPRLQVACGTYPQNNTAVYVLAYKYDNETAWRTDDNQARFSPWQCPQPVQITQ